MCNSESRQPLQGRIVTRATRPTWTRFLSGGWSGPGRARAMPSRHRRHHDATSIQAASSCGQARAHPTHAMPTHALPATGPRAAGPQARRCLTGEGKRGVRVWVFKLGHSWGQLCTRADSEGAALCLGLLTFVQGQLLSESHAGGIIRDVGSCPNLKPAMRWTACGSGCPGKAGSACSGC